MTRIFLLIFAAGMLTTVGCKPTSTNSPPLSEKPPMVTTEDVQRDAETSMKTTAAYSEQSKEILIKDLRSQLATMDANIEKLRRKGEDLVSDAKAKWDLKMSELDVKRKSANDKLMEIENSTAQAWSDVEKGAQTAWDELKTAFQNASNEF